MVLSLMRRHAKSWLIKFLIGMIAIVFIFYFGYSFTARKAIKVAQVNGEPINHVEYRKTYFDLIEGLRNQYQEYWNENLIKALDLKNRALDNLISQKLITQEAKRLGLRVTEDEVQQAIMGYPAFQVGGQFNMGLYRSLLNRTRMKPEDFEEAVSKDLLQAKIRQFLSSYVLITNQEILDMYTYEGEKVMMSFVHFKPDDFKKSIQVDESGKELYYNEHKESFRVPERVLVKYIELDPKDYSEEIQITEDEISDYYESHTEAFQRQKEIKARHILFKLDPNVTSEKEKEVLERAEEVLELARNEADFAELAEKYSEGPSKSKGGDLGYFSEGKMVKQFEEAAFRLEIDEVSDLVRSPFGYHIIKLEDIKEASTKPLEEVRNEIEVILIGTYGADITHEKGLTFLDQMPYDVDLTEYASEQNLKIKETPYFALDESIPGINADQQLRESLFALEEKETSELIEVRGKFYIFQVADRKASFVPEMKDISEKVKKDYENNLALLEAKAAAESALSELKQGKGWKEMAEEKGLKPEMTDYFTRRTPLPMLGYQGNLIQEIFNLDASDPYPAAPFESDMGAFIFRWIGYKGVDINQYEKEKDAFLSKVREGKQTNIFQKWLEGLFENASIEKDLSLL